MEDILDSKHSHGLKNTTFIFFTVVTFLVCSPAEAASRMPILIEQSLTAGKSGLAMQSALPFHPFNSLKSRQFIRPYHQSLLGNRIILREVNVRPLQLGNYLQQPRSFSTRNLEQVNSELYALHEIFREKIENKAKIFPRLLAQENAQESKDKVSGSMDILQPIKLDENGGMNPEDFRRCSSMMSICFNMVQKVLTKTASANNIPATEALKNMDAWVEGFTEFPLPIFNFKDTQNQTIRKDNFSITVNPEVVDTILNIQNLPSLKNSVIGALRRTQGNLASYSKMNKTFNYFGVITGYSDAEISIRVVKFGMRMKETDIKSLCGGGGRTLLDSDYDTYQFVGNKTMMTEVWKKMEGKTIDYIANKLYDYVVAFYDQQVIDYEKNILEKLKKRS